MIYTRFEIINAAVHNRNYLLFNPLSTHFIVQHLVIQSGHESSEAASRWRKTFDHPAPGAPKIIRREHIEKANRNILKIGGQHGDNL